MAEFKVPIFHYDHSVRLLEVCSSSVDAENGLIALQSEDVIEILSIPQQCILQDSKVELQSSTINSHKWANDPNGKVPRIAVSSISGNLGIYAVQGNQSRFVAELHRLTLKSLIQEKSKADIKVTECQVLNFFNDLLLVLVDKLILVLLKVNETRPWEIVYSIDGPQRIVNSSVTKEIICMIDSDHSILLHDLCNGNLLAVIKRDKEQNWVSCRLSSDYLHIVLQNEDGELYCSNLDSYFKENSLLLNKTQSSVHSTGHWYEKLAFNGAVQTGEKHKFHTKKLLYKLPFSGECLSYNVAGHHVATLCLSKHHMALVNYNLITGSSEKLELNADEVVVLSHVHTIPHFILSENHVSAAVIGSFLTTYSSVSQADLFKAIMELNKWDTADMIPIARLKSALKMRNMEAVNEFFKSRASYLEGLMSSPPIGSREDLSTICSVVSSSAKTYFNHTNQQSHIFAKQTVDVTISFLKEQTRKGMALLNDMLLNDTTEKKELLESLVDKISDHEMNLMKILSHYTTPSLSGKVLRKEPSKSQLQSASKQIPELTKDLVKKWNKLTDKEIIGDGILMGNISLLQAYFTINSRQTEGTYDHIVRVGLDCVLDELENKNWQTACQMLKNMGFGVFAKLTQMVTHTTDVQLRSYLITELVSQSQTSGLSKEILDFSDLLSNLYPCQSFQEALNAGRREDIDRFPSSDIFQVAKYCGEIGFVSSDAPKSMWYSHYMLDWLTYWIPYKHEIVLDRVLHTDEHSEMVKEIPEDVIWIYLARYNQLNELVEWIEVQHESKPATRPFQNLPITADMIDKSFLLLPAPSKQKIEDKLTKYGVLSSEASSTTRDKIIQLIKTGVIYDRVKSELVLSTTEFIGFCISSNYLEILFLFFTHWSIKDSDIELLKSSLTSKEYLQLVMMYSFHKLTTGTPDVGAILDASLSSFRYLLRNPHLDWTELMDKQISEAMLCCIAYQAPFHEGSPVSVPESKLAKLIEHPLLRHLVPKDTNTQDVKDVTIYSLLQKWGKVNCDRMFAWQKSGSVENGISSDASSSDCMPHFADEVLISKYGYDERLSFLHYLKQSRPSFAFVVFLAEELTLSSTSTIPAIRLTLAVNQTYFLALKHYDNLQISAACVAFLEMLNESTKKLRLLLSTAHMFHQGKQLADKQMEPRALHFYVESMLLPLIFSKKRFIRSVYEHLIDFTEQYVKSKGISESSLEAGLKYTTAIEYSKEYGLPIPTRFLEICAKENNWLSFLVFSQIYSYSHHELMQVVNGFTDDSIREHLQCVLDNASSDYTEETVSIPQITAQDKRAQLYARMGLMSRKTGGQSSFFSSSEDETMKSQKEAAMQKKQEVTISTVKELNVVNLEHLPNDLFAVLFTTHNHKESWRLLNVYCVLLENPVMAVLAGSHKESDDLECLSAWLLAHLPHGAEIGKTVLDMKTGRYTTKEAQIDVIHYVLDRNRFLLVTTAFRLFIPDCPLIPLLNVIRQISDHDFTEASASLTEYKALINEALKDTAHEKRKKFTLHELTTLSLYIIQKAVRHFDSFLCERFLHLLDNANLYRLFIDHDINFSLIHQVYKVVYDQKLSGIDRVRLVSSRCVEEAQNVISILEEKQEYSLARKLSNTCQLDVDLVTVKELITETEQARNRKGWQKQQKHESFWRRCDEKCRQNDLDPKKASNFFESQVKLNSSLVDKITLSSIALSWAKLDASAFMSGDLDRLQKLVWECKINKLVADQESDDYVAEDLSEPPADTERRSASLSIDKTQFLLTNYKYQSFLTMEKYKGQTRQVQTAVSTLIGDLLDDIKIDEACHLATEYRFYTNDLIIILACIGLTSGTVSPESLDDESWTAGQVVRKKRTGSLNQGYLLTTSGGDDFIQMNKTSAEQTEEACLSKLSKLSQYLRHGVVACEKIICCYKISRALEQSYRDTVLQSEYSLLKLLIQSSVKEKYNLAQEYISTGSLSDSDVASFLASNLCQSLSGHVGLNIDDENKTEQYVDDCSEAGREYRQLIQLFSDPTIFGNCLLDEAARFIINEPEVKAKLAVKVELLILAHDAHTCAYDMEGISSVLRACRSCALQLAEVAHYTLMVHMLTGIGRYSEMTYVLDTLKMSNQFELLFKCHSSQDDRLRLAVLDYLRRFCPGDTETYRVVSSHFAMHREIAELLEATAVRKLSQIAFPSAKSLDNFSTTLSDIQKNFTDSAEFYLEGQCLGHAQHCVKQARLVFLQVQLLSSGTQVINLEANQVKTFIENHDKFYEAFAVSEAYNKNVWASALCNNVLVKGDLKYLNEFKKTLPISASLITEVVQRFQLRPDLTRTAQMTSNIHKLLSSCKDILVKYSLARDLELHDVMNDLLTAEHGLTGAVIKDTYSNAPRP